MKSHLVSPVACPSCKTELDAARNATPKSYGPPKPGDFTVCAYCASILVFTAGGGLRPLRPGEFQTLHPADRMTLESLALFIWEHRLERQ